MDASRAQMLNEQGGEVERRRRRRRRRRRWWWWRWAYVQVSARHQTPHPALSN